MTATLPFPVYDADNHLYEPEDAFTRHLPDRFKNDFYFVELKGRKKLVIGGMLSDYIPNPTFAVVAPPGAHEKWFRGTNTEGLTLRELSGKPIRQPLEWRTGDGRLAVMDKQNIHAALVFPTLASVIEERIGVKADTASALFHSLNTWIDEEWGFARQGRLFSAPFVSLADIDLAVQELEFILKKGARCVAIRPAPVPNVAGSRSFGLPEFDPFWSRVAEAGIFVCLHASDSGYDKIHNWWTGGQNTEFRAFNRDALQDVLDYVGRAISDSVAALICHGVFQRFPSLRIACVENGSSWVGPLIKQMRRVYGQTPKSFAEPPDETFQSHFFVAPFYENDMEELRKFVPIDRILFGSDFPHPEGLAEPLDYLDEFKNFGAAEIEKIFCTNMKGLLEGKPI